jgi:hypothetical protein
VRLKFYKRAAYDAQNHRFTSSMTPEVGGWRLEVRRASTKSIKGLSQLRELLTFDL